MPGNRRYPLERIRYASYIWPADWQPERTSTSTSTSFDQDLQQHCACCIRSSYYVTSSPEAFQRHRLVLSRCEQFGPSLLDRHGYSKLISDATSVVLWAIWTNLVYDSDLVYMSVDYFYFLIDWLLWRVYGLFSPVLSSFLLLPFFSLLSIRDPVPEGCFMILPYRTQPNKTTNSPN